MKEFSFPLSLDVDDAFLEKRHLVAFSGGPDSVFLLLLLSRKYNAEDFSKHIELAYVNYHDSPFVDQEQETVDFWAARFRLRVHRLDVEHQEKDGNFEDWARQIRYRFFRKVIHASCLDDVLTAHQKDDAVETYLLQKERHSLPRFYGLAPTSLVEGVQVIRLLLSIWKTEIYAFLKKNRSPYFEDPTNHDDHTKRNILRRELSLAKKKRISEEIRLENARLSQLYKRFSSFPEQMAFQDYRELSQEDQKRLAFFLLDKHEPLLSHERREGLGREVFEFLKGKTSASLQLKEKVLYRLPDIFFIENKIHYHDYEKVIDRPGFYDFGFFSIDLQDPAIFNNTVFPITIRNVHKEDKIGTALLSKSVPEFLKKQKVPFYLRPIYPVFVKEKTIFFVPFYSDIVAKRIPILFTPFGKKDS